MITNDFPNGAILIHSETLEAIVILKLTTTAKWGYNLNSGRCWVFPADTWFGSWHSNGISNKHISKAKLLLESLFNVRQINNLDYIEALAKIKEYEKEKD